MSYINRILTAMRPQCIYRPTDLAVVTHLEVGEVAKILKMLESGGLVECIRSDEYRRKRMYKTRQEDLFS